MRFTAKLTRLTLGCCVAFARATIAQASATAPTTAQQAVAVGVKLLGVYDDRTGTWLDSVIVRDTLGNEVRTTASGLVALNLLAPVYGYYLLELRREGYSVARLRLRADSASEFMVGLVPHALSDATALPASVTTATYRLDSDDGARDGFARRCTSGARCVSRRELDLHPTQKLADLLSMTKGIHRSCSGSTSIGPDPETRALSQLKSGALRKNAIDEVPTCQIEMLESLPKDVKHPYCVPTFFLNGAPWTPRTAAGNSQTQLDKLTDASTMAGIEVYPVSEPTPARFLVPGSTCGSIVIWTR